MDPEILPPLSPFFADMDAEMAALDVLGPAAPTTLRQARQLARLVDRSPSVGPEHVAAVMTMVDMLTRQEVIRLEALADSQAMRRLRRRARTAPGYRGPSHMTRET